jgi:hypothetical protein
LGLHSQNDGTGLEELGVIFAPQLDSHTKDLEGDPEMLFAGKRGTICHKLDLGELSILES